MIKMELEIKLNKRLFPVLFFSVIILSSILALGINLGFADMPWVDRPINVLEDEQTKEGKLGGSQFVQKDWIPKTGMTWELSDSSAWFKSLSTDTVLYVQNDVIAYDQLQTKGDLGVGGTIYAPNQGFADTIECTQPDYKYTTPNTAVIWCPNGWYFFKLQISDDGVSSKGWCASPFMKEAPPVVGDGGSSEPEERPRKR